MEMSAQDYLMLGALLGGYVIGSIPFAVIISRIHGVNILRVNSGNPGATNVKRSIGKGAGNIVFALDFLKGFLPVAIARLLGHWYKIFTPNLGLVLLIGLILGHNFSIFLRFKGGKGISTTMGGLLALMPWCSVIGMMVWVIILKSTGFVSLASLYFETSLRKTSYLFEYPREFIGGLIGLMLMSILKHRDNIKRLLAGTEYKFTRSR
jgi:glycerol-3-phosphate acyltransferase PlsY